MFGATIIPDRSKEIAFVAKHKVKDYMKVHQRLGHPGRDKLLGTCPNACEDCLIAKAQRMNLSRESKTYGIKVGKKIMINISLVNINNKKSTKRFRHEWWTKLLI